MEESFKITVTYKNTERLERIDRALLAVLHERLVELLRWVNSKKT